MEKYCKRCGVTHESWRYREKKRYWDCNKCRSGYYRLTKFKNNKENNNGIYRCEECNVENPNRGFFDIDHIKPRSEGGGNLNNVQVICPNCHRIKSLKEMKNYIYIEGAK